MNTPTLSRPKAYSYLRFSTPEQMRGDSFRRQTAMAQEWCLRNGYTLDDGLTFRDLGVSAYRGANLKTGRLGDFLEAVRAGQVLKGSLLLVEALDRVTRLEPLDALDALRDITREGITVVTLNDNRSYTEESLRSNFVDLMVSLMLFMRANEESATKARRLRQAWDAKRNKAAEKPLTAAIPAWLRLNKETQTIEGIPDRVALVQRIFKLTLEGQGMESIAHTFNQEEIKPWGRSSFWHRSYIKKIQETPAVIGWFTPRTNTYEGGRLTRKPLEPIKGYYPQIISEEDFNRVKSMKAGKTPRQRAGSTAMIQSILAGLAVCPLCGSTMTRVMKGDPKKAGQPKLICTKAKTGRGCTYHGVPQDNVETAIRENIAELLGNIPSNAADLHQQWQDIQDNLEATESALEATLQAVQHKPLKSLLDRLEALERERESFKEQALQVADQIANASNLVMQKRVGEAANIFKEKPLDVPKANAALRTLFDKVTIDWQSGILVFHWKHQGTTEVTYAMPKEAVPVGLVNA